MRNKNIIIAAVLIVSFIGAYAILYIPLSNKLKSKVSEYANIENRLKEVRRLIDSCKMMRNDIAIISEKYLSLAIDELTKHGKDMGIEFRSIKPQEAVKIDPLNQYKMLPVDMEIEASDKQLSDFLGSLDELKKSLIKIESMDIFPDTQNKTLLKARVVINIYFSSGD